MAVYLKVKATARIKIQDPYDGETIKECIENLELNAGEHEEITTLFECEIEDAD